MAKTRELDFRELTSPRFFSQGLHGLDKSRNTKWSQRLPGDTLWTRSGDRRVVTETVIQSFNRPRVRLEAILFVVGWCPEGLLPARLWCRFADALGESSTLLDHGPPLR